jgi:hypothetical protein
MLPILSPSLSTTLPPLLRSCCAWSVLSMSSPSSVVRCVSGVALWCCL